MNKSELIDAVASTADISKADATRATDAVLDSIIAALGKGDQVTLLGFGTWRNAVQTLDDDPRRG